MTRGVVNHLVWDHARFARWLKRYKQAEGLTWTDLARESGLHPTTWHKLAREDGPRREVAVDPSISTLVAVSKGLGLDIAYVLSQASAVEDGVRWHSLTRAERRWLMDALATKEGAMSTRLLEELEQSMKENGQ